MANGVVVPVSKNGRPMSPYERRTGVVLPIWGEQSGESNRHHAHFYRVEYEKGPRKQRAFLRAVRFTRLQRVARPDHQHYHDTFDGTLKPRNQRQSFIATILNEAGYIPPWVVDVTGSSPKVTETTPQMRQQLRAPGILTIERSEWRRAEIGQFLMHYAIGQELGHVKEPLLEEFVGLTPAATRNNEQKRLRKLEIGMKLTNIAIGVAVEPIERPFQQARDMQSLREEAPVCAFHEVKQFVDGHEPRYYDALRQQIEHNIAA